MTPAVSVVVATYNYGRFLTEAVRSALEQTFDDLEVVILDDGSTDDTPALARSFRGESRVRYVRTEHRGVAAAKNAGAGQARAPLVAFLDADDVWLPDKLERQVPLFDAGAELGVVFSRRLLIDEEGWPLEHEQPPLHRGRVLAEMFLNNFVCFSSAVVRREVFERAGPFDERLTVSVDYDLWLRVARHFAFDYVDEPLVRYRVGHASLSQRREHRMTTVLGIMRRFLDEQGGRALIPPETVRRAWAETYCSLALAQLPRSRIAALASGLRAVAIWPGCRPAWRTVANALLPETVSRGLRRALGRPDWRVVQRRPACLTREVERNQVPTSD